MQIIKGINKSKFINDYCNRNKEIQFLLIDVTDNSYPFECDNLMLFKTNRKDWIKNLKECDDELSNDIEFFLFTNDVYGLNIIKYYEELVKEFNREIYIVLQDECDARIEYL
jgi:hypothetical protein